MKMSSCYYCLYNSMTYGGAFIKCELDIEGYPLPASIDCRHFEFDTGDDDDE